MKSGISQALESEASKGWVGVSAFVDEYEMFPGGNRVPPAVRRCRPNVRRGGDGAISGGGILPLADFVRANYGEDNNSDPGTNYATDSAVKDGPISAFGSNVEEITMESGSLKEAAPTALSSDGTSFSVYWDAE
jgi:hypothetical protein